MLSFTSTLDSQEILLYQYVWQWWPGRPLKFWGRGFFMTRRNVAPRACGKKPYSFFPALPSCHLAPEADTVTGSIRQSGKMKATKCRQKVQAKGGYWKPRSVWKNTERKRSRNDTTKLFMNSWTYAQPVLVWILKSLRTKIWEPNYGVDHFINLRLATEWSTLSK